MAQVILKPGKEKPVKGGHPWIFSGAIQKIEGSYQPGEIVTVMDHSGQFLAKGFINPKSQITVRILTRENRFLDKEFFRSRLQQAMALRGKVLPADTDGYRLVNSEGDFMPGLIIDRYGDTLVIQIVTAGMERVRETLLEILREEFNPVTIYERSDKTSRKLEGLTPKEGLLWGKEPDELIEIKERGASFFVDVKKGQKTGFFLDQRDNRRAAAVYARGLKVLNCFSYSGGFSVMAALAGANEVTSVDISEEAVALACRNFELNGIDPNDHQFVAADVFEFLRQKQKENERYDVIILDPPAFVKARADVEKAARGYKDINLQALKLLEPGGILVTCSCSHHLSADLFRKIVFGACVDAGKDLQVLEVKGADRDHPVRITHPEGEYLKCIIGQVAR